MTKKATWEENGLLQLITLRARSIPEGSQGGNSNTRRTWRQELKRRPWRNDAYWLTSHRLFGLLSYRLPDYQPRGGPTHNGLQPLILITNLKTALQICPQPNPTEAFLNSGSLFSRDSTSCQVDKLLAQGMIYMHLGLQSLLTAH